MAYVKNFGKTLKKGFFHKPESINQLILDMVSYAEIARRDGILSLENVTKDLDDQFIVNGIQMAVDGTDPELIEQIMNNDLDNLIERHGVSKAFWTRWEIRSSVRHDRNVGGPGDHAPEHGRPLQNRSRYGRGVAYDDVRCDYCQCICVAVVRSIGPSFGEEVLIKTIIIKGVMAIQSGDNPRIVEQKLRTFLPPSARQGEKSSRRLR